MYKELEAAGKLVDLNFDPQTQSSWVYDGTNFWSIESPQSLIFKRQYIQDKHLAGVMIYSLETDGPSSTLLNAATRGHRLTHVPGARPDLRSGTPVRLGLSGRPRMGRPSGQGT